MRGFPIPADVSYKDNIVTKIIHGSEREETLGRQQSPITIEMYVAVASKLAKESAADSVNTAVPVFQFYKGCWL